MNMIDKAIRTDQALRQLREEMNSVRHGRVRIAIGDFLASATDETKARLFDIVTSSETKAAALAKING